MAAAAVAGLAVVTGSLALVPFSRASAATPAAAGAKAVPGSHPAWAEPAADRGAVAPTTRFTATVYLAGSHPAGLAPGTPGWSPTPAARARATS